MEPEQRKGAPKLNPIYRMEHPFAPLRSTEDNLARAKRWLRWLARTFTDIDTVAEWIPWVEVLDDSNPIERARGLALGEEMAKRLDGLWLVGGRISNGMKMAITVAVEHKKTVFDLTTLGDEPPTMPEAVEEVQLFVQAALDNADRFHRLQ